MKLPKLPLILLTGAALVSAGCSVSPFTSFGSSTGRVEPEDRRLRPVGDPAFGGGVLETPDAGLTPLIGDFDTGKALRAIYGHYNAETKRATWQPTKNDLGKYESYSAVRNVQSRVIFSKAFESNGFDRYFVITSTAANRSECAECTPVMGGAIFTRKGDEWVIDTHTKTLTRTGVHGELGSGKLVKFGRNNYGVLFHWKSTNLGIVEEGDMLLAETKAGIKEVFSMITGGNNKAYCDERGYDETDAVCWSYSSKLEFVPQPDSSLYEIQVSQSGTKMEDNEAVPVRITRRFNYVDGAYRSVTRERAAASNLP